MPKKMLEVVRVKDYLKDKGYSFFSGVPCSLLKGLMEEIAGDKDIKYIPAVRENAALGVASGAHLAGRPACVLMQNSGLGNVVNALTSFNLIYKIPVLLIISWRGFRAKDAPEHLIMGKKTISLLNSLGVPCRILSPKYKDDIDWALEMMGQRLIPVALILKQGLIK